MPGPGPCSTPQKGNADRVVTSTGVFASAQGGSQAAGAAEAEAEAKAEADGAGSTDDADGDGEGAGPHAATRHRNAVATTARICPGRPSLPAGSLELSP
jgi:hypothetical protein